MDDGKLIPLELEAVPRTKKEICKIIKLSYDTLRRRLNNGEIKTTRALLDLRQQELILKEMGFQVIWKIGD